VRLLPEGRGRLLQLLPQGQRVGTDPATEGIRLVRLLPQGEPVGVAAVTRGCWVGAAGEQGLLWQ
jgi:hypothetical protein